MKLSKVLKIGGGGAIRAISALILLSMFAPRAWAGLLYEPSNYAAQDALVLHLDGIRNAGALKAHDSNAEEWVNLANANRSAVFELGSDTSRWEADGFYFGGLSCARIASMTLAKTVTIEVVSDIDTNVLVSARSPSTGTATHRRWPHLIGAAATGDMFNLFYHTDDTVRKLCLKSRNKNRFDLSDWEGKYAVGIINNDKQVLVQNDAPNSATWKDTGSTADIGAYEWLVGSANVESGNGMQLRYLTGKIKAIRVYNRVLDDSEIEANRAIDEARFFGGIPVTNVVVATAVVGVEGNESSGAYAFDSEGHTFAAPASVTVGDDTYSCAGYTLETWDAGNGVWGEATTYSGTSCQLADTVAKVRLTWQWTHTSGPGLLDADGYAQDGLVMHLDGIRNVGLGRAHDNAAAEWVDLANVGTARFTHYNDDATSCWTEDGYWFGGRSYATMTSALEPGGAFTVQVVSDVDTNALKLANTAVSPALSWSALIGTTDTDIDAFNLFYNNGSATMNVKLGNTYINNTAGGGTRIKDWKGRYLTVVKDGAKAAYSQNETPASAEWHQNFAMAKTIGPRRLVIGSSNGSSSGYRNRFMIGTIKAVRIYNRALTDAELAANRELDDARFFGKVPATDTVLVASSIPGVDGNQVCGVYKPAGFTFTAPAKVETATKDYVLAGYTIETWDDSTGTWGAAEESASTSWTSPAGTGWTSQRLTWKWTVSRGIRTAADYDVDDYVKKNLVLHIDGIRNVGPDKPHSELLMLWRDLSTAAVSGNNVGVFKTGAADTSRKWLSNGFYFGGATYADFVNAIAFTNQATVQAVCNLDVEALRDNADTVNWPHLFSAGNQDRLNLFFHALNSKKNSDYRLSFNPWVQQAYITNWEGFYATGMRSGDTARVFQSATSAKSTAYTKSGSSDIGTQMLSIGTGHAKESLRYLTGTINTIRVYDRALTDDELAQNRKVDEARFFGRLSVTNVVVATGEYDTTTEAPGVYEVEGSYTFTAGAAVDENGKTRPVVGYTIETLDGNAWGNAQTYSGSSYTYTVGTSPDTVRLTWKWQKPGGLMIIVR